MLKKDLLELPRFHKAINTCMDDNLDMICEKLNRVYALSFYKLWRFDFNGEEEFSQKIYLKDEINQEDLEKYCGIKIQHIQYENFDDVMATTIEELKNNNPIVLHMYRKKFPWDVNYKKENVPDFFVHKAMAIDINGKDILFTDGYCNKFNEYLSIETCKNSATNKITKVKVKEEFNIDINSYFKEYIGQLESSKMFENLKRFSEYLRQTKEIEELTQINDETYQYSHMNNSITKLTRSRMKTKELIKCLGEILKNEELQNLSKEFDKSIMYWEYINQLFLKYTIDSKLEELSKIANYIDKIIDIEKNIYIKLKGVDL